MKANMRKLVRQGKHKQAQTIAKREGWKASALDDFMREYSRDIGDLVDTYKEIADPQQHTNMTPAEKTKRLKNLAGQINKYSIEANKQFEQYKHKRYEYDISELEED